MVNHIKFENKTCFFFLISVFDQGVIYPLNLDKFKMSLKLFFLFFLQNCF